jgi:hypothetical protein
MGRLILSLHLLKQLTNTYKQPYIAYESRPRPALFNFTSKVLSISQFKLAIFAHVELHLMTTKIPWREFINFDR